MVWLPRVRERCGGDDFRLFKVRVASRRLTGCIWISGAGLNSRYLESSVVVGTFFRIYMIRVGSREFTG